MHKFFPAISIVIALVKFYGTISRETQ